MLPNVLLSGLNHLLKHEAWARTRLQAFAGQTARFELGAVKLHLHIGEDGLFQPAPDMQTAHVTITLGNDAPIKLLLDKNAALASAHISGAADLAETIGFVFRNLKWDMEADLAKLFGDIAARRLAQQGSRFLQWKKEAALNMARNVADYLLYEKPQLAARPIIEQFKADVLALSPKVETLEQRIAHLEKLNG